MRERKPPTDPRRSALRILDRVERSGAFASALLEREAAGGADPRDAALVHELVLGVLREQAALDFAIERVSSRPVAQIDPELRTLLRIGAYSLLRLDRVPAFAAVDTAVELARESRHRSAAGFVNAVLRRISEGGASLLPGEPTTGDIAGLARWSSHPEWWLERAVRRLGWQTTMRIAQADNQQAATVLRPCLSRISATALSVRLAEEGVDTEPGRVLADALRVRSGVAARTAAFREGLFWMQDEASQIVGTLAAAVRGPLAADLCAAPGGKTLMIADALPSGGVVVAMDRNERRMARLRENRRRLSFPRILPVVADATAPIPLRGTCDAVLVDAPCSGTGTLRRHPEIRWRLRPEDLERLAQRQSRILASAAGIVGPGGLVVYSVCSIEPEEGESVVTGFLDRHQDFECADPRPLLPAACHRLIDEHNRIRTETALDGLDGFFAAVLRKRASPPPIR